MLLLLPRRRARATWCLVSALRSSRRASSATVTFGGSTGSCARRSSGSASTSFHLRKPRASSRSHQSASAACNTSGARCCGVTDTESAAEVDSRAVGSRFAASRALWPPWAPLRWVSRPSSSSSPAASTLFILNAGSLRLEARRGLPVLDVGASVSSVKLVDDPVMSAAALCERPEPRRSPSAIAERSIVWPRTSSGVRGVRISPALGRPDGGDGPADCCLLSKMDSIMAAFMLARSVQYVGRSVVGRGVPLRPRHSRAEAVEVLALRVT